MKRRDFLRQLSVLPLAPGVVAATYGLEGVASGVIPSSGERLPVIGMGSWLTFDVGTSSHGRASRTKVLKTFFDNGGTLVDSSPMYGSSEAVIGHCLKQIEGEQLFSATKVWTPGRWLGVKQMERSVSLWHELPMDLLQVHNLLDWKTHLKTLRSWKEEGRVRYIGVTTSHGRRHDALAEIMRTEPIDFVQLTYNIVDREAEQTLLPIALDKGIAVIANRPFKHSLLFDPVRHLPVPGWARDIDCDNWAQIFLKFAVSHPAVTCAVPATSRVDHMQENMGALKGTMPNAAQRLAMAVHYASL
ncbi:MAG: aldo/keto reductase [Pseudomonadota bacterium]